MSRLTVAQAQAVNTIADHLLGLPSQSGEEVTREAAIVALLPLAAAAKATLGAGVSGTVVQEHIDRRRMRLAHLAPLAAEQVRRCPTCHDLGEITECARPDRCSHSNDQAWPCPDCTEEPA